MDERYWFLLVSGGLFMAFILLINYFGNESNDLDDFDELAHEAKIATQNYIDALNAATSLIKASYACTTAAKRNRHANRFIRVRKQSTPLRNGIRILKKRDHQRRANAVCL
jgi:hypothetical protein